MKIYYMIYHYMQKKIFDFLIVCAKNYTRTPFDELELTTEIYFCHNFLVYIAETLNVFLV